jgi:hypothetical protein
MLLEQLVDGRLDEERVVDGDGAHVLHLVPARLPAARDGAVHEIVAHEEKRLQNLNGPAERGGLGELRPRELAPEEVPQRRHHADAAVHLAAQAVVLHALRAAASN